MDYQTLMTSAPTAGFQVYYNGEAVGQPCQTIEDSFAIIISECRKAAQLTETDDLWRVLDEALKTGCWSVRPSNAPAANRPGTSQGDAGEIVEWVNGYQAVHNGVAVTRVFETSEAAYKFILGAYKEEIRDSACGPDWAILEEACTGGGWRVLPVFVSSEQLELITVRIPRWYAGQVLEQYVGDDLEWQETAPDGEPIKGAQLRQLAEEWEPIVNVYCNSVNNPKTGYLLVHATTWDENADYPADMAVARVTPALLSLVEQSWASLLGEYAATGVAPEQISLFDNSPAFVCGLAALGGLTGPGGRRGDDTLENEPIFIEALPSSLTLEALNDAESLVEKDSCRLIVTPEGDFYWEARNAAGETMATGRISLGWLQNQVRGQIK